MQQKLVDLPVMKKCSKCGEEKEATKEFFHANKKGRNGIRESCKECTAKSKCPCKYYKNKYLNKEIINNFLKFFRICGDCEKILPASRDFFSRQSNNTFYRRCKPCVRIHMANRPKKAKAREKENKKKYYNKNSKKIKVHGKKYRANNREKYKAHNKKYYANNREKHIASCKKHYKDATEKHMALVKKYRDANPEKVKIWQHGHYKRKLAKFAYLFNLSKTDMRLARILWSAQVRQDKFCAICNLPAIHAHHILHASKYPKLSMNPNNGIPLCRDHHAEAHLFDPFVNLIRKGN